jgi:hypothetical protein
MISVDSGFNNWWHVDLDVSNSGATFDWSFNHTSVKDMTILDAAKYTAELIANKYDNLHLLMSGGLDSEFVASILYQHNIPFTPVIACAPDNHNQDYFFAMYWCRHRNITPLVIEFKTDELILKKYYAIMCKKYGILNNSYLTILLIDKIIERGGYALVGETNLTFETLGSKWDEPVGEILEITPHGLLASICTNGSHPGEFLAYTPELLLALIKNINPSLNNPMAKATLYNVPFRPKSWPSIMMNMDTQKSIQKICKVEQYPPFIHQCWKQSELISILNKTC